jgi:urease accessory protein
LKECFFTPPFKVANISADKNAGHLDLVLMCSSPGVLDNDEYKIEVTINESASIKLHTQSYQRLFQMKTGASQQMNVFLKENASFTFLPHPAVPHANSIFTSRNNIYMENNCTLTWGEIITCGRQLKDEVFSFSKYHNITQVFLNNRLVIRENLLMQPSLNDVKLLGQLEGYTHQASLIYLCDDILITDKMNAVLEFLSTKSSIEYGISKTPVSGFLLRILGYKAEQLHDCLQIISGMIVSAPTIIHTPC